MEIVCNVCKSNIPFNPEELVTDEDNIAQLRCRDCGAVNNWDKSPWDDEQQARMSNVAEAEVTEQPEGIDSTEGEAVI